MSRTHRRSAGHQGARAVPFPGGPATRTARGPASRRQPWVAVVVAVAALAGCLVAAELALRALSAHALLVLDVEMWRYARRVKAPSAAPGLIEVHRSDARARLMGVDVRTDEHGFRRPAAAIEAARRPDDRRVAVIGDSLTFGWGVAEDETFAARLESALRNHCPEAPATVWNAGVGNSNTAMQLARYDLVVAPLRPQWVVLGYFVNDAEPDPETASHPLIWRSAFANLLVTRLAQGTHGDLRDYREYYAELYEEDRPGWRATRRALGELGRRLADDGVAATLLLLPEMHHPRGHGPFAEIYTEVAARGEASGFEVIDTAPGFPPGPGERFWVTPTDAHPDGAAHAIFAEALLASRHACPGATPDVESREAASL
ncbi:MAG TPA: GDSL-type esterase/lipase family protein [Thermoanaerobaculia bacterium]|nr:GDSL-type esterase/lipase family protein [Thermoanaerobaculia bacterium]